MVRGIRPVGLVLALLAAAWALQEAGWGIPCPLRWAWGVPCPGCGMGRACALLARGEWSAAWAMHPGGYLLLGYAFCSLLPKAWCSFPKSLRKAWWWAVLAALGIRWAYVLAHPGIV